MALTLQQLISPDLLGAANRIFAGMKQTIPVYIHESPGKVLIGGGAAGPQEIQTLAIDSKIKPWMISIIEKIDEIIDLDFYFSPTANASKINIYLDTLIEIGGGGTTLGLTLNNEYRRSSWWEIVLNGPPLLNNDEYFRFAFVHELGHVLGLEHPFDGSDGDIGGERFGDPDANVTVMSYTKPAEGWPDFYAPADLAALASTWGLETEYKDWLIRDGKGTELLLERGIAENRLKLFITGDKLVGAAPLVPAPPKLETTNNKIEFQLIGLIEQAHWEYSWDGGVNWEQGSGSNLSLLKSSKEQLNLRQKDRWGRFSPENLLLIEPGMITTVTPALILPASTDKTKYIQPIAAARNGEQYLLWSMDKRIAAQTELAEAIRAAIMEINAVINLDFKEIQWHESNTHEPGALQLFFSHELDEQIAHEQIASGLLNLQRKLKSTQIAGTELILEDRITIQLTDSITTNNMGYALLHGICKVFGLQSTAEPLNPNTTVMAQLKKAKLENPINKLTDLDRKALALLYDQETGNSNESANSSELNSGTAIISINSPIVGFRSGTNMENISIIEVPIQREGNLSTRIKLGLNTYGEESIIILEPWQKETRWKFEIPSGKSRKIKLKTLLPIHAELSQETIMELEIDLHKLEFAMTNAEIINHKWQKNTYKVLSQAGDILITWNLDTNLEEKWGKVMRRLIKEIDEASGIQFLEVSSDNQLLQWEFKASNNQKFEQEYIYTKKLIAGKSYNNSGRWLVHLGEDPKEITKSSEIDISLEQLLLQELLLKLGLEKPEQTNDGDYYNRTPVYPEDSALFNKNIQLVSQHETTIASLQKIDRSALEILHGKNSEKSPSKLDFPGIKLNMINTEYGQWLSNNGVESKLQFEITRNDNIQLESRIVIANEKLGIAKEISMAPGEIKTTVNLGIPYETTAISEPFTLHILSGGNNPTNSKLNHELIGGVPILGKQILADPITGWNLDFNGDKQFSFSLEGLMLMRFSLGTFPGSSLTAGMTQTMQKMNNQNQQLVSNEYDAGDARRWLESGLTLGILDQNKNGKLETFEDILTNKTQNVAILESINRYGLS